MPTTGNLLTPAEVAGLLGVSPKTIYDHAEKERIPCRRIYTGQPRFEPLVVQALREGASEGLAWKVQEAIDNRLSDDEVMAIWRDPKPGTIVPIAPRRRKAKKKTEARDG